MSLATDGFLDRERLPRLVAELERQASAGLWLGGQLRLVHRGRDAADAGFGEARPGLAMGRQHRMLWLSSSKPLTAVAILQLWERGALTLDDRVGELVPGFGMGGKERISIRHLLTHTAGIRMLETGWPTRSWPEIVAAIAARRIEPGWVPGRRAGYHTESSWFVLAEIVRRVDGRPIERYLREELFEPLRCGRCSLGLEPERYEAVRSELAPMYERTAEGCRELGWVARARVERPSPGANGWGPLRELARFYEMLAGHGELDGRRFLRPQTVEALTARHRVGMYDRTFRTKLDWGLGVIVNSAHYGDPDLPYGYGPHAGARTYGHSGARSSTAFYDPEADLIVALAVNVLTDPEAHRARFHRLFAAIYEDLGLATPMEQAR